MITDKDFLKQELEWGMSADNPAFLELARLTIGQLNSLPISTVLDYGAGTGVYSEAARKAGYKVYAYDIWEAHKAYMAEKFPDVEQVKEPITTDLMMMIEVAEHMTDKEVKELFGKVKPTYLLFSACPTTTDNDEYWGHINIKSPDEWHKVLKTFGYELVTKTDYPTDHTFIYLRK